MKLTTFFKDEAGAVTVDWVVLTAALVGLALAVMTVIRAGVENQANDIDHFMSDDVIIRVSFVDDGISGARDAACALTGALCNPSLTEASLRNYGVSDLDSLEVQDYASDYVANLNFNDAGPGDYVVSGGTLQYTIPGVGVTPVTEEQQAIYDNNVLASAAQNALIEEERAARYNN